MAEIEVSATRKITAPAQKVYDLLRDYHEGHRLILPEDYFQDLIVEKGGTGEGTVFLAKMIIMGRETALRMEVLEPEPGRRLVERNAKKGITTTFIIEPIEKDACTVTIHTVSRISSGLMGWVERLMNPGVMKKIYADELDKLAAHFSVKPT